MVKPSHRFFAASVSFWQNLRAKKPWMILIFFPLLILGNFFFPIFIPSSDGSFWYCLQPHLGLLLLNLSLAVCLTSPLTARWKQTWRITSACACVMVGLSLYVWTNPERIWRSRLEETFEIRLSSNTRSDNKPNQKYLFSISDRKQIEALAAALEFAEKPWQTTHCWCIPSLIIELINEQGECIIKIGSNHQAAYIRPEITSSAKKIADRFEWEHFPADLFRLEFQRILASTFEPQKTNFEDRERWWILRMIGGEAAYSEIAEGRFSKDPEDRVVIARILPGPYDVGIQPLIELGRDSDLTVRRQAIFSLEGVADNTEVRAFFEELSRSGIVDAASSTTLKMFRDGTVAFSPETEPVMKQKGNLLYCPPLKTTRRLGSKLELVRLAGR